MLVELAARHAAERRPPVGLELVFTVAEEDGLRGAKELDLGALRSPFGFVLDHASPIGEVITAAPTYKRVAAEFEGIEAHAGIRPEDGRSAIAGRGRGDRRDGAGPPRRGDDGERRRDRGRDGLERRAPATAGSRARRAASTTSAPARRSARWSTPARGRPASTNATSTSRSRRCSAATGCASSAPSVVAGERRARALRRRAARGRDGRRQRRQRVLIAARLRVRAARQRDRGEPHAGGERRGGADRPDARRLRGDRSSEAAARC